jgi:hypothetical protein
MTTYYVVMTLNDWSDLQVGYGRIVMGDATTPDGSAHFLSVFATEEAARAAYPNAPIVEIVATPKTTPADEEETP